MKKGLPYALFFVMLISIACQAGSFAATAVPGALQTAVAQTVAVVETNDAFNTLVAKLSATPLPTLTNTPIPPSPTVTFTPTFTATATFTNTPTATATATRTPTRIPPTAPPLPTAITGAIRINFAAGATSAVVAGSLAAGGYQDYVLRAGGGQVMMLMSDSNPSNQATFWVRGADGSTVLPDYARTWAWHGVLPSTQDYLVRVQAGSGCSYHLNVVIPVRIQFAPGAISQTWNGSINPYQVLDFLARGNAGQTMTVRLTSPANDVLLTIYGLEDGNPYIRYVSGATEHTFVLPMNQDYVIEAVATGAGATSVSVFVQIQ